MTIDFSQIDLTQIILAIITLIGAILTRYLIPYFIMNVDEKKRIKIADMVDTFVEAADRYLKSASGEERLKYVLDCLAEKGIKVDIEDVHNEYRVMIESAVEKLRIKQNASQPSQTE